MSPRGVLLTVLAIAAGASPGDTGPWGRSTGQGYAKLSASQLTTTRLATPAGVEVTIPEFRVRQLHAYGELGIGRQLTLIGGVPVVYSSRLDGFGDATGLGDLRLGLQSRLGRGTGPWVFAVRGLVQVPVGDATRGEGLLPTGSGVWEGELWLSAGRTWGRGRGYFELELGEQIRAGGYRDGAVFATQLGYQVADGVKLGAFVRGVEPFGDGDSGFGAGAGLGDGTRYIALGPQAVARLAGRLSAEASLQTDFHTRNIATGTTLRLGLSLAW